MRANINFNLFTFFKNFDILLLLNVNCTYFNSIIAFFKLEFSTILFLLDSFFKSNLTKIYKHIFFSLANLLM